MVKSSNFQEEKIEKKNKKLEVPPPTKDISLDVDIPKSAFGKFENVWSLQDSRNSYRGGETPNFNDQKKDVVSPKNIFSIHSETRE